MATNGKDRVCGLEFGIEGYIRLDKSFSENLPSIIYRLNGTDNLPLSRHLEHLPDFGPVFRDQTT
jgi:hypothetical protein